MAHSPERKQSKSKSASKKKLSEYEKDQLYKKKLKTIGNTYMYQALEKIKKNDSPKKIEPKHSNDKKRVKK